MLRRSVRVRRELRQAEERLRSFGVAANLDVRRLSAIHHPRSIIAAAARHLRRFVHVLLTGRRSRLEFPVYIRLFGLSIHPHILFESLAYFLGFRIYLWTRPKTAMPRL